jgi:PPM family protein phosphatase
MGLTITEVASVHEQGQRKQNEDSIYPANGQESHMAVYMVADGVGGAAGGALASSLACQGIATFMAGINDQLTADTLQTGIAAVQQAFDQEIANNDALASMATTLVLLQWHHMGATVAHVGDSRCYHVRAGKIIFRTKDHSLVNMLLEIGQITEEQARTYPHKNTITRAIQSSATGHVTLSVHQIADVLPGDTFLLCSDGILEAHSDDDLEQLCATCTSATAIAEQIKVKCALLSRDNYSAHVLLVGNAPAVETTDDALTNSKPKIEISTIEAPEYEETTALPSRNSLLPLLLLAVALLLALLLWWLIKNNA